MSQFISSFSWRNIKSQVSRIWITAGVGIFVSLAGAGFTVLVATLTDNPIWKLAKDPSEVLEFPPYIGMLSNWGAVLWMAAAVICLFSAVLLKRQKAAPSTFTFIAASGSFSLLLGLDDLFLLHDRVLPKLTHISEDTFYVLYVLAILIYTIYFIRQLLQHDYLLFGSSLLLFLMSRRVFVTLPFFDQFMTTGDMLKYFGIVFWLAFFYRTALFEVSALFDLPK